MSDLRIVKGNAFSTSIQIKAYTYYDGREVEDFDLQMCTDVVVKPKINWVDIDPDDEAFSFEI